MGDVAGNPSSPTTSESVKGLALAVENLSKSFGRVKAVSDVSFAVAPGEFLTLLGPSGSGKTTILRLLGGFEYPDAGNISLGGDNVNRLPPYRRNIGVVFQKYALFPHMTVEENIAFPLRQRKVASDQRKRRVEEALELVGLEGLGKRSSRQLSGGQQQRVALARAMVFRPEILLMDEPLGALDKKLRERMQREIRALQQRVGITTVYVTHDQSEAMAMSDRIAVIHEGCIEQIGPPGELYERPATEFVAGFVGDSNLLEGEVLGRVGDFGQLKLAGDAVALFPWREGLGQRGLLLVRPEKLSLTTTGESADRNRLEGRVQAITYMGDATLYEVAVAGANILVRQPNRDDVPAHAEGDQVDVVWSANDCAVVSSALNPWTATTDRDRSTPAFGPGDVWRRAHSCTCRLRCPRCS